MVPICRLGFTCSALDELDRELSGTLRKGQDLPAAPGLLQKVCPVLHHSRPWLRVQRVIVGRANGGARRVGGLKLDMVVGCIPAHARSSRRAPGSCGQSYDL